MNIEKKSYQEILEENGRLVYTVKGISMLPILRQHRDIVVIEKKPYKIYDVVLFCRKEKNGEESLVLHRIVKRNSDGTYLIYGDNTYTGDVVENNDILGVMTSFIRNGKKINTTNIFYKLYVRFYGAPYRLRIWIKSHSVLKIFRCILRS